MTLNTIPTLAEIEDAITDTDSDWLNDSDILLLRLAACLRDGAAILRAQPPIPAPPAEEDYHYGECPPGCRHRRRRRVPQKAKEETAALRQAFEAGIALAKSYGDNIHHCHGEQLDRRFAAFLAKKETREVRQAETSAKE